MFSFFKKPPMVGIIAFLAVFAIQPLGHIAMILMEKLIVSRTEWYGPVFDSPPEITAGYENFSIIQNNIYVWAAILGLIGFLVIYWGIRRNTEIAGTWAGFIGASLMWTGWTEFSIHFYSRYYGVKALCDNGEFAYSCAGNPATKPEYLLMQSSVGFLVMIMFFFFMNKESRCNMFRWFHRTFKMKVGAPSRGLTRNFANIVAIETFTILWFFYVYLMLVYDETLFGEHHWFTYLSFVGFGVWSLYLIQRLLRYKRVTSALRYAIPTAIIFWNTIELMGRWNWFKEFWIHPLEYKLEASLTLIAMIAFAIISIKTAADKTKQID